MTALLPRVASSLRVLVRVLVLPALALLFFLVTTFLPALTNVRHGFPTYYVSARLVLEGRWTPDVYDNAWFAAEVTRRTPNGVGEVFAPNPPTAALLMLPLAWLDLLTARQVWLWLSLGLLVAAATLQARPMAASVPWARAAIWALPFLYAPVHENFRLANVYGLLLFLFTLAWVGASNRTVPLTGPSLGLAAGLKLSGSPLWLLVLVRRRWREIAVAALLSLLLAVISLVLLGTATWQRFLVTLVEHAGEPGWAAGLAFQTTPSFFQHLFRPDPVWNPQPVWVLPAWVARACTLLVSVAALAAFLKRTRTARVDLAFAAALTLGVVLLPFAEEYHYILLVLPFSVALGHLAAHPSSRLGLLALAVAFVLLGLPWDYKDPWLNLGWHAVLGYPRLYGGWLLWAWLMAAMTPAAVTEPQTIATRRGAEAAHP